MKKAIKIAVWSLVLIGTIFCLAFVSNKEAHLNGKAFDVTIKQGDANYFILPDDIRAIIRARGDSVINQPLRSLSSSTLEHILRSHADVQNAEVYITLDGKLKVDVEQRKPVIRVIEGNNESYYIDANGKQMPLSEKFTARVLVATGNLSKTTDSLFVVNLYKVAKYIDAQPFWKAQIVQVYVNADNELELIPRAGNQRILFGEPTDIEAKFNKLLIFYEQGLNPTGWWNQYSVINLKFKNQVVCTKKENIKI